MVYGDNVITGGTPSADTELGPGFVVAYACDGNTGTEWISSQENFPHWWKYDLGSGITKTIAKITILKQGDAYGCTLKDFEIQGSNNNSDWTTISTKQAANVTSNTSEDFEFTNSTAYRYYRIYCTSSWYTNPGYTTCSSIFEITGREVAVETVSTPTYSQLQITTYTPQTNVIENNIISTPTYAQLVITSYSPNSNVGPVSTPTYAQLIITTYEPSYTIATDVLTMTFYPDAHPETTSVDGVVYRNANSGGTWADIRDGDGNGRDESSATVAGISITSYSETDKYITIRRSVFLFDITTLPSEKTITAAVFSFKISSRQDTGGWLPTFNIYSSNPATNNALVVADYGTLGTTPYCDIAVTYAQTSTGVLTFTLNAAGLAALNTAYAGSKIFKLGAREAKYDVANSAPVWAANKMVNISPRYAESTEGNKPTLVISYAPSSIVSTPTYAQLVITTYQPATNKSEASTPTYAQLVITTYTPSYTVTTFDYRYSLSTGSHKFFSKAYRDSLVLPNYISVSSLADDLPQYSGYAIEPISNAIYDNRQYEECTLASNAQGTAIAQALRDKYKMAADYGFIEVPMNPGQEMFDFVGVVDTREGDSRDGNVGYIRRIYNNLGDTPEYSMTLGFGNWFPSGEPLTETSPGGLGNKGNGSFERLYALDGYIENLTADNILLYTLDDIDEGTTYKRVLATQVSAGKIYISDSNTFKAGYDPSGKRRVFVTTPTTPYDEGDLWMDDDNVKRCTTARASGAYNAGDWTATTMDAIGDGAYYGRVLATDISAGHILLSETLGSIGDIADGGGYAKVLSTQVSSGYIILNSSTVKTGTWYTESGVVISATSGIALYGGQIALRTYPTYADAVAGTNLQVYVGTNGKLYAGAGNVYLDAFGLVTQGQGYFTMKYGSSFTATLGVNSSGNVQLIPYFGYSFVVSSSMVVQGNLSVSSSIYAAYNIHADGDISADGLIGGAAGVIIPNLVNATPMEGSLSFSSSELFEYFFWYRNGAWNSVKAD